MTFISYAQNDEDVTLYRALKHVENGFYARKAGLLMYDFIEDGEFMNVIYKPVQT